MESLRGNMEKTGIGTLRICRNSGEQERDRSLDRRLEKEKAQPRNVNGGEGSKQCDVGGMVRKMRI